MEEHRWDRLVQQFLHRRNYTRETKEHYDLALRTFRSWADDNGVDPLGAGLADLMRYRTFLVAKYSANTVNTRFRNLRLFFTFLFESKVIDDDLAPGMKVLQEPVRTARSILTFEELEKFWCAARPGRERVMVGLLGICGLKRNELRRARVEDLHIREGVRVLTIPQRRGSLDVGYVAIPDRVSEEIDYFLAGRRSGLVLSSRSSGTIATTSIHKLVHAVAKRAGLDSSFTSMSLTYALRSLAVQYNFSYVSVVRTIPAGSPLTARELFENVHLPPSEHASMRLGRMIAAGGSDDERMLFNATLLLEDRAQHCSVSVMLASATLEKVLREKVQSLGLSVTKRDPTLATYANLLRSVEAFSIAQLRTVERILTVRNDAAHGWFDHVTVEDAEWLLLEAQRIVSSLRASP